VRYPGPLVGGRLVRRYKRFFADVELGRGASRRVVTAHCANPGSMRTCAEPGGRVWLLGSNDPKRRLAWTWELAEIGGAMVSVNTARANQIVAEAIAARAIAELGAYDEVAREAPAGDSRIDFLLRSGGARCWVEVKCATMDGGGGGAAFPDSVTDRGARHVGELARLRRAGDRAVLLFCVARAGVSHVRPADEIDPVYGDALRRAARAGVEVYAYRAAIDRRGIALADRVPVDLTSG
jgi:sugar fermentation stimulation protein A